ncbi:hypothetical protein NFL11_10510 [Citrobacter braakii]|uniref:hypothetical protein n=1 Tax=Citrobacter braakii TaxID=57706 RepID=UPI0024319A09|nr:hypothetical protein [Citrobacter braakii]WGA86165.1 hypothetical protein NFL11_10510 [Citrobacter braakii]
MNIPTYQELEDKVLELAVHLANAESKCREPSSREVTLPAGYAIRSGHPINDGERGVMIPKDDGTWLSKFDVEHAIRAAGIGVKGE